MQYDIEYKNRHNLIASFHIPCTLTMYYAFMTISNCQIPIENLTWFKFLKGFYDGSCCKLAKTENTAIQAIL